MDYPLLGTTIRTAIALVALILAYRYVLLPELKAAFRAELFSIRRDLFMLVATGKIGSRDPGYVQLRAMLNALLRRAEDISGIQVVIQSLMMRKVAPEVLRVASREIMATSHEPTRRALQAINTRTSVAILRHLMHLTPFSPSLWIPAAFLTVRTTPIVWRHIRAARRERLALRNIAPANDDVPNAAAARAVRVRSHRVRRHAPAIARQSVLVQGLEAEALQQHAFA